MGALTQPTLVTVLTAGALICRERDSRIRPGDRELVIYALHASDSNRGDRGERVVVGCYSWRRCLAGIQLAVLGASVQIKRHRDGGQHWNGRPVQCSRPEFRRPDRSQCVRNQAGCRISKLVAVVTVASPGHLDDPLAGYRAIRGNNYLHIHRPLNPRSHGLWGVCRPDRPQGDRLNHSSRVIPDCVLLERRCPG